jgi:dTDP-3,4-didehydro-2,6-dideoxy-alpha-D-glucose 3-reductase
MTPVRIGALGCAGVAWARTLPAIAESTAATLTAVASRDEDKARRFADRFGCTPVTGYEALLERDDVDAVYVPLPTGLHFEWCARALRAGKHVLAEKPLAVTARETGELAALAGERGLCLMENRVFTQHTQHDAVRKLVVDGKLGELRSMHATMAIPPLPAEDVRYRADLGGGALLDVGYYPLHAALLYLPEPVEVVGATLHHDPDHGVDTRGAVLLRAGDGVTAHLTFGFEHSYRSAVELWGSQGRLVLERAFTPPATLRPVVRIERQNHTEELTLPPSNQRRDTVDAFAAAVRAGHPPGRHLEVAVRAAELMDTVRTLNRSLEHP